MTATSSSTYGEPRHVGTMDLDIGLSPTILDEHRYQALTERIRQAKFMRGTNVRGQPTNQRWVIQGKPQIGIDFLIAPTSPDDVPGKLRNMEQDFAAVIAPGLDLAFMDQERVRLDGKTPFGETATREVGVAGPAAFVILKALAFRIRGLGKDAYDLCYVLRHFPSGLQGIARRFRLLADFKSTREALIVLGEDFAEMDSVGPRRLAEFALGAADNDLQADARGLVADLLEALRTDT